MTDQPTTSIANRCYRHPDRESFVRCQRCGRTVCVECQTLAAVGVHCPECVREARASAPRVKSRVVTAFSDRSEATVVTYILMGIVGVLSLLTLVPKVGSRVFAAVAVDGSGVLEHPWTILTHVLVNFGGLINIAFGLFTLFWFGRMLEAGIGRIRYLVFVVITAVGGAAAAILFDSGRSAGTVSLTVGLLVGIYIVQRHFGTDNWYLLVFVFINIGYNVFSGGGFEAIIGGAIAGAATAFILVRTRRVSRNRLQIGLLAGLGVLLLAICFVAPALSIVLDPSVLL